MKIRVKLTGNNWPVGFIDQIREAKIESISLAGSGLTYGIMGGWEIEPADEVKITSGPEPTPTPSPTHGELNSLLSRAKKITLEF